MHNTAKGHGEQSATVKPRNEFLGWSRAKPSRLDESESARTSLHSSPGVLNPGLLGMQSVKALEGRTVIQYTDSLTDITADNLQGFFVR